MFLKKLIQFTTKKEGKVLFIGNSIKGDCIPDIYDEDIIMNKYNCLYINTQQSTNYEGTREEYLFDYNKLQEYCPNHSLNKDKTNQTLCSLISRDSSTIFAKGRIEIKKLEGREFDIYIKIGDYKHYVGSYPQTGKDLEVFEFDIELPKHLQTKLNATNEPVILFSGSLDKTYNPRRDYDKVSFNYKVGVDV